MPQPRSPTRAAAQPTLREQLCQIEQGLGVCHVAQVKPWRAEQAAFRTWSVLRLGKDPAPGRTLLDSQSIDPATARDLDAAVERLVERPDPGSAEWQAITSASTRAAVLRAYGRLPEQLATLRQTARKLSSSCDNIQALSRAQFPDAVRNEEVSLEVTHKNTIERAKRLLASSGVQARKGGDVPVE
mmetsp:Transcript_15071/g.33166  ORF Transcript_15071/g.33166 Transcript_15071/m.33166 type:complete len:186 (-) Transcript_15071:45-602(-)